MDLTPVRDETGPARLLDMVEGRSAYREPDRGLGKFVMQQLIDSLTRGVPGPLVALRKQPYLEAAHSRYPRLL